MGNWQDRQVSRREFVAVLAGMAVVGTVGIFWGLEEGGSRGGAVVVLSALGLVLIAYMGWMMIRHQRRYCPARARRGATNPAV